VREYSSSTRDSKPDRDSGKSLIVYISIFVFVHLEYWIKNCFLRILTLLSRFFSKYWLVQEKHVSILVKKNRVARPSLEEKAETFIYQFNFNSEERAWVKTLISLSVKEVMYKLLFYIFSIQLSNCWGRNVIKTVLEAITFVTDSNINPTTPIGCLRRSNCQKRSSSRREQ